MRITAESPLILGSASPRRKEIVSAIGIPFVVVAGAADENVIGGEAPTAYLERVVHAKLHAVCAEIASQSIRGSAVLVADTSVIIDDDILGKPADAAEARRMLERLSGRTHNVMTRFVIGTVDAAPLHSETVITTVLFRAIPVDALERYAASGEGLDKAGGYAIQGGAQSFVVRIEGSYTNVVGLPAAEVAAAIETLSRA